MPKTKKLTPAERNQSAFNRAVTGVIAQGRPSRNGYGGSCRLRGLGGCKCAIGHLIKDDAKARELDAVCGGTVAGLAARGEIHPDLNRHLLIKLQFAHDCAALAFHHDRFIADFKARCRAVAEEFGLDGSAAQ